MKTLIRAILAMLVFAGCASDDSVILNTRKTLEDLTSEGDLYTSSTQSLLRQSSWLDHATQVRMKLKGKDIAYFEFKDGMSDTYLKIKNFPIRYLIPRLNYVPPQEPDEFEAFNLMLAEFSRNGLSVPLGEAGDAFAHYETNLEETVPWKVEGDFNIVPNPRYRPLRVSVINNCLFPGLWEFNANDRSGEIYHAWFDMPPHFYYKLVADVNHLPQEFAQEAVQWSEKSATLRLERLRVPIKELGETKVHGVDDKITYSSNDSRRKIGKKFALIEVEGETKVPKTLSDLQQYPVYMSDFVPPGKYSYDKDKAFDFSFFQKPISARVTLVNPLTRYSERASKTSSISTEYIEIQIEFETGEHLIVGNLPLSLLVNQEDYAMYGFGVGVLSNSGFAERRNFLMEQGHAPSFAYFAERHQDNWIGLNSHKYGLEQIFIRSYPFEEKPYWELIVTSFERIIDIARIRVDIPTELQDKQRHHTETYVTPIYFSYRDDNIR